MNDEQQLLASAYLDGALTSDERARAEADPEVMEAVARLGEIRPALAGTEPPDPARRDAAINAALEVFDAERRRATPPPVSSLAARRSARWLMPAAAAAAAVVIIAGGIVATRGDDGGGDDSAGSADTTFEVGAALDVADESTAQTASAQPGETGADGDDQESAAATTDRSGTEAAGTFAAAATAAPEATAAADGAVLSSPADLTEFASVELLRVDAAPGAAARVLCDQIQGQWLGPATYVLDGVETPVEVFLVAAADEVRAVDTATCAVVATAPAPER